MECWFVFYEEPNEIISSHHGFHYVVFPEQQINPSKRKVREMMFNNTKDWTISKTAPTILNKLISANDWNDVGKIAKLSIDSSVKTISLDIMLLGESEPIHLEITKYSFTKIDDVYWLECESISVSRQWMQAVADKLMPDRIELPSTVGKVLSAFF